MGATAGIVMGFLIANATTVDSGPPPLPDLVVSPATLDDNAGPPELVLRHAPDSRSELAAIFVLYSSGVVLVDNRHWGDPSGYRVGRLHPSRLVEIRKSLAVPPSFFDLPTKIQAGSVRDGASYEIIAISSERYKRVEVTGLIHSQGSPYPIFAEELKLARSATPKSFLRLLDGILAINLAGGSVIRPHQFKLRASGVSPEFEPNCPWPEEWPHPTERTKIFSMFSLPYHILEMDGSIWSDYLEATEARCRGRPLALGGKRYFVRALVSLPGEENWLKH